MTPWSVGYLNVKAVNEVAICPFWGYQRWDNPKTKRSGKQKKKGMEKNSPMSLIYSVNVDVKKPNIEPNTKQYQTCGPL